MPSLRQSKRKAGQRRPGIFAFLRCKASARESHQKQLGFLDAKPRLPSSSLPLRRKASCTGKPSARPGPIEEGLCRLLSEPTPSPRLCISATGATPQRTRPDYPALAEGLTKTGTFYFAGKQNFLLCLDMARTVVFDSGWARTRRYRTGDMLITNRWNRTFPTISHRSLPLLTADHGCQNDLTSL